MCKHSKYLPITLPVKWHLFTELTYGTFENPYLISRILYQSTSGAGTLFILSKQVGAYLFYFKDSLIDL